MAYPLHISCCRTGSNLREREKEVLLGRVYEMDNSVFEARLNKLLNEINDLPAEQSKKILALARQTKLYNKNPKKNPETIHDSLDHLRLMVKYILFDLEATRRENKYLRRMLENHE